MSSAALSLLRRRPVASTTLLASTTALAAAFLVESHAERNHSVTLPRDYDADALSAYWKQRPISLVRRFGQIAYELTPIAASYVYHFCLLPTPTSAEEDTLQLQHDLASKLRHALTNLGPAFIKAGQQLSIRPDLVPPPVLQELGKLCDAVRPIDDETALAVIRQELGEELFAKLHDLKLVAAASLGQVYQGTLLREDDGDKDTTRAVVAVKVQRPWMRRAFSLDLVLLQQIGILVDTFTSLFTNQPPFHKPLYESFAAGSYRELDYEQEAANQVRFQHELASRHVPVIVPDVYNDFTTQRVITTQWIDGIKLADSGRDEIRRLIPVGVELFLTQLLDIGAFHADPHPGNLLVTKEGKLCLLDFGLCAEVDLKSRNAMTKAIVHLLSRDFDALVHQDAKELGFLPHDYDTSELKPLLTKILTVGIVEGGSDLRKRKRKLQEISSELNEVFFRYPFSVPPFFALVTRGLGLLEGIALSGDPDFDIFRASAPYARRRAIALMGWNTRNRRMTER